MRFKSLAASAAAAALALLSVQNTANAQTNSALLTTLFPKEQAFAGEAGAVFLENGHSQKTDEDFRLSLYQTYGRVRLVPGELASPRIGYNFTYLDLHSSFNGLPDRLVDQSIAAAFPIAKTDNWIFGASLGVGYAGDSFFGDGDAYYGLASIAAFRQLDDTSALVFVLDYDGNRTYFPDFPLPGVAYNKRIGDTLELTVGLPVSSIRWKPYDQLSIQVDFLLPDDARIDIGYEVIPHVTVFGRARVEREAFYVDGLPQNYDRILFEQRRAEAGVRFAPCKEFSADIAIGYAWSGEFSEGFDFRGSNEITDISDEPYIRAGLQVRF